MSGIALQRLEEERKALQQHHPYVSNWAISRKDGDSLIGDLTLNRQKIDRASGG